MASRRNKCDRLPLHFPDDMWTVRGLWVAVQQSGKHLRYCKSADEKAKAISVQHHTAGQPHMASQMAIDLDRIWPSLEPGKVPSNRWLQEWQTHGVCTGLGEDGYFGMILNLHQQFSMYNILGSSGVYPDDIYTYRAGTLKKAIREAHGFEAELYCRRRRLAANGRFAYVNILQEIHFCYNIDLNPIDCPIRNSTVSQIKIQHDKPFVCAFDVLYPKFFSAVQPIFDPAAGGARGGSGPPSQAQVVDPPVVAVPPAFGGGGRNGVPLVDQPYHVGQGRHRDPYDYGALPPGNGVPGLPGAGTRLPAGHVVVVNPGGAQPGHRQYQPHGGPSFGAGPGPDRFGPVRGGVGRSPHSYGPGAGPSVVNPPVSGYGPAVPRKPASPFGSPSTNFGAGGAYTPAGGGPQYPAQGAPYPGGGGALHGGGGGPPHAVVGGGPYAGGGGGGYPQAGGPPGRGGYYGGSQFKTYHATQSHFAPPADPGATGPAKKSQATHDPLGLADPANTGNHMGVPSDRSIVHSPAVNDQRRMRPDLLAGYPAPGGGTVLQYRGTTPILARPFSSLEGRLPLSTYKKKAPGAVVASKQVAHGRPTLDGSIVDNLVKRLGDKAAHFMSPVMHPGHANLATPEPTTPEPTLSPVDAHFGG